MQPLQCGLVQALQSKNWHNLSKLLALTEKWPLIVGDEGARQCEPAFVRRDVLYVSVANSIWMQQLQLLKREILANIKHQLPDIKCSDIRYQLQVSAGKKEERQSSQKEHKVKSTVATEKVEAFARLTETVDNQDCREALLRLYKRFQEEQ